MYSIVHCTANQRLIARKITGGIKVAVPEIGEIRKTQREVLFGRNTSPVHPTGLGVRL